MAKCLLKKSRFDPAGNFPELSDHNTIHDFIRKLSGPTAAILLRFFCGVPVTF